MMDDVFQVAQGIAAIAAVIGLMVFHYWRSNSILERWASANGFQIVSQEYRNMFRGPFFWTTSKSQTVYRVTVRDHNGRVLAGWVRCGGYFFGLLSDHAEVRWD